MQRANLRVLFIVTAVVVSLSLLGHAQSISIPSAQGTIAFDAGSNYTLPHAINAAGQIAGSYGDANGKSHGFLRDADGHIISFEAGPNGTSPVDINAKGKIVGSPTTRAKKPTVFCECHGSRTDLGGGA